MKQIINDTIFLKYFNKTYQEIVDEQATFTENYTHTRAKKFNEMVGDQNNQDLLDKYYNSYEFLREQVGFFNNSEEYYRTYKHFMTTLPNRFYGNRKIKVLDYGCGNSRNSIKLLQEGHKVTLADLPHRFFKVLEEGVSEKYPNSNFINVIDNKINTTDKFNLIICSEMLEHCIEPIEVLQHLINLLEEGGYIYLSTFFNDCDGADPSHLVRNTERYGHCQTWHKIVGNMGLEPILYNEGGSIKVWKKCFINKENKEIFLDNYS